jgi:glycosyltransferase involved in cell wall biosynthesis
MAPQVTILMTTYNGLSYLDECIRSVINQDFEDFEFLIIDDASTDGTYDFLKSLEDKRIKILQNQNNIGQTASLNKGLGIAAGEFIVRLDQDDLCLKKRVGEQLSFMMRNPTIAVACSYEYSINNSGVVTHKWKRKIENRGDYLGYILLGLCPVWHPSVIFRKSIILGLGGYDPSYGPAEDYHLWSKIGASGFNGAVVPNFHLLQRNHEKSQSVLSANAQKNETIRAQQDFISKFICTSQIQSLIFSQILRVEVDGLTKDEVIETAKNLDIIFKAITKNLGLSRNERYSLQYRVIKRVGIGFIASKCMRWLNPRLFILIFYLFSPMYISSIKKFIKVLLSIIKRGCNL